MANTKKKNAKGAVELFVTREFFNSLVKMLNDYVTEVSESIYARYAAHLKNKIMKHSRAFVSEGEECAVVYFYEDEAALLIKLYTIYFNAITKKGADFYSQIGKDEAEINENVEKFFSDLS